MLSRRILRIGCVALPLAVWVAAIGTVSARGHAVQTPPAPTPAVQPARQDPTFVGSAPCAKCHESMHRKWSGARHSKMLQPATTASVLGDFSQGNVTLRGTRFTLERTGDTYLIRGAFPTSRDEAAHASTTRSAAGGFSTT